MTTPEKSKELENEARKEWEEKNEKFKIEIIDRIKEELIRKSEREWREEFKKNDIYYPGDDADEDEIEEIWNDYLLIEKLAPLLKAMKDEYLEESELSKEELDEYSAWQICGGFGSTPNFEMSPKFDLEDEKSIVNFFKEKLAELEKENQK